MSLTAAVELIVPLMIAFFFSAFYESDRDEMQWAGIVAMSCWLVTGMLFLVMSSYPTIALIFLAVGIVYVIRLLIAFFKPLDRGRRLEGEL